MYLVYDFHNKYIITETQLPQRNRASAIQSVSFLGGYLANWSCNSLNTALYDIGLSSFKFFWCAP